MGTQSGRIPLLTETTNGKGNEMRMLEAMTEVKTIRETRGIAMPVDSYVVVYGEHDRAAMGGLMIRDNIDQANRSARLMEECGYQRVEIHAACDLLRG